MAFGLRKQDPENVHEIQFAVEKFNNFQLFIWFFSFCLSFLPLIHDFQFFGFIEARFPFMNLMLKVFNDPCRLSYLGKMSQKKKHFDDFSKREFIEIFLNLSRRRKSENALNQLFKRLDEDSRAPRKHHQTHFLISRSNFPLLSIRRAFKALLAIFLKMERKKDKTRIFYDMKTRIK